jgi:hypothetical protein
VLSEKAKVSPNTISEEEAKDNTDMEDADK